MNEPFGPPGVTPLVSQMAPPATPLFRGNEGNQGMACTQAGRPDGQLPI